jgi:hypothetical protein
MSIIGAPLLSARWTWPSRHAPRSERNAPDLLVGGRQRPQRIVGVLNHDPHGLGERLERLTRKAMQFPECHRGQLRPLGHRELSKRASSHATYSPIPRVMLLDRLGTHAIQSRHADRPGWLHTARADFSGASKPGAQGWPRPAHRKRLHHVRARMGRCPQPRALAFGTWAFSDRDEVTRNGDVGET